MGSLVGTVGSLLGGGNNNSQFQAGGVNQAQLNGAMGTTNDALAQQNALAQALNPQGVQGMGSQLQLGQALQQQAQGQGPNPAAAQLANATGQNIAAQSALMAGQRGANANAGLIARQAGQQGAGIQQQAVGQNAVLQAQQQLAAQGQLQNLAATQIGQQAGAIGNYAGGALQNQGQLLGTNNAQNTSNAGMASANAGRAGTAVSGLLGAAGGALAGPLGNLFGSTPKVNTGGIGAGAQVPTMYDGGEVPSHFNDIHNIYHGGNFETGGMVPGQPQVNHNSPQNDVVDAKLTPKEIVLPLSVTESDDPAKEAAKFVAAIMAKKGGDKKQEEGDFKIALKDAIKSRKKKDA